MNRCILIFLTLICCFTTFTEAQKKPKLPTVDEILRNVETTISQVTDFSVNVEAVVNLEGLRVPKSQVKMAYKKPDKVHFTSSSFAMIPRGDIMPNVAALKEKFEITLAATEEVNGKKLYKLQLVSTEPRLRFQQNARWVDASNWTIVKSQTVSLEGSALTMDFDYVQVDGKFWLPASMKATFETLTQDKSGNLVPDNVPGAAQQFNEFQRPPRSGSVSITFTGYKVNVGIPDEYFESK
jgi:outer membrane lipoprotein-sorting protein